MALNSYRGLDVWQVGMQLVEEIYQATLLLPSEERFGLVSQLRRAAVSIPTNIAEGYGRSHRGDYLHHLSFAKGSAMEIETLLTICVRLKLLSRKQAVPTWTTLQRVGRMLTRQIASLSNSKP